MVPWSETILKPIWHNETPTGGNMNTLANSKTCSSRIEKDKKFKATLTANYK